MLLHTRNQNLAQPKVPTVHRHYTHSRKYDDQAQIIYLHAFINSFGHKGEIKKIYQKGTINSKKISVVHI